MWKDGNGFSYGYTWVNMRHGKLWRITRGGNVRITAGWIVKYGLGGFNRGPKSPPVATPHDPTYWNTPVTHIILHVLKMSYQPHCKYCTDNSIKLSESFEMMKSTLFAGKNLVLLMGFVVCIFEMLLTDASKCLACNSCERDKDCDCITNTPPPEAEGLQYCALLLY